MRDSRILLLIVIMVLGDLSRAEIRKKLDEYQYPLCMDECLRGINKDSDMFSEWLRGPKYCKGMKDIVACWDRSCIKEDEKAAVNKTVEEYRDFFENYYHHYKCILRDDKMEV